MSTTWTSQFNVTSASAGARIDRRRSGQTAAASTIAAANNVIT